MKLSNISFKDFLAFYHEIYEKDSNFKDNKSGLMHLVCNQKRAFYASSKQEILGIKKQDQLLCACVLIIHQNAPELLSIAFFEALPNCQDAVDMLMNYARQYGQNHGCTQMVVSLDGHINNSVAFVVAKGAPSFGESYCPPYYHSYFGGFHKTKYTSFYDDAGTVRTRIAEDLPRLDKYKEKITLEFADFGKGFAKTMKRYTDLNNEIFVGHKHYFHREYQEDADLFADMRPLLENKNLIFARADGRDIGFMLWYPDFNELVPRGKGASALTFLKYKLLGQIPKTTKVVEIGVCAKYRRYGTILLLFDKAMQSTAKQTTRILSSWIVDENTKSKGITMRYTAKHYKDYYAYEKDL